MSERRPEEGRGEAARRPGRSGRWRLRAAAVALGLLIGVVLLEGVLRVATVAPFLVAPERLPYARAERDFVSAPGGEPEFEVTARYNYLGFRGRDLQADLRRPRMDAFRVLCLGDSVAEGMGVQEEERFSEVLAALLGARLSRPVRAYNLGALGKHPGFHYLAWRDLGRRLRPDVVVIVLSQNDPGDSRGAPDDVRAHLAGQRFGVPYRTFTRPRSRAGQLVWRLLPRTAAVCGSLGRRGRPILWRKRVLTRGSAMGDPESADYPVNERSLAKLAARQRLGPGELEERVARVKPAVLKAAKEGRFNPHLIRLALAQPHYLDLLWNLKATALRRGALKMMECLELLVGRAQRDGARVVVAIVPLPVYASDGYRQATRDLGFVLERETYARGATFPGWVNARLARLGVPIFDMASAGDDAMALYYPYDLHPNAAGHRLLAERLAEMIVRLRQD